MTRDDSFIARHANGGVSYVGEDAIELYRVTALCSMLKVYAEDGHIVPRGGSAYQMLGRASEVTHKDYPLGLTVRSTRASAKRAVADLQQWIAAMKAALPEERIG